MRDENLAMTSINFEILRENWPSLADFGAYAEKYLYTDPQSAVIKLRCLIETLIPSLYRKLDLEYNSQWDLYSALKNEQFQDIVDEKIMKKFHAIRINANKAIHHNKISISDTEWLLKETYDIACWVHSVYLDSSVKFQYIFKLPEKTEDRADVLEQTIKELEKIVDEQKNIQITQIQNEENDYIEKFKTKNKNISNELNLNNEEFYKRVTLEDIYADYQLNHGQQQLIGELDTFLKNPESHIFLLKGFAGTGKTFITKGFTEYLTSVGRKFILAAPTGKAAKVIKEKTKNEAHTIHKSIYSYKDLREYKVENIDGTETFKFYFELNDNTHESSTVYIIDEASMIGDKEQEGEFFRFGSGRLLTDLMKYINIDHNDHNKKIIFIGDNAQLPPIGMNFSPALNPEYLEREFNLKCSSYELTEIIRQSTNSGIVENSLRIRESIRNNIYNQLSIDLNYDDVNHIEYEEVLSQYLNSCGYKINGESIIIAHSNTVVDEYNTLIRKHFFPNHDYITAGDKIMAVANNGNHPIFIYNGDFGLVKKVDENIIKREVFVRDKINTGHTLTIKIPLWFRKVEIGFKNIEDDKSYFFECLIFENILYRDLVYKDTVFQNEINNYGWKVQDINRLEILALYVDFVNRAKEDGLKPNTNEFKQAIKADEYFNALKIKFGYALTCHKAQGSEWNNVFVNCKTHQSVLTKDYFRWLYTAITRTSKILYLMDEPHIKLTSGIKRIESIPQTIDSSVLETAPVFIENGGLFGINPQNEFLTALFNTILVIIEKENISIEDVQHNPYQEVYFFKHGEEKSRINIYYNGKQEISNISPHKQDELSSKLTLLLSSLNHKKIIIKKVNNSPDIQNFSFSEPFLEEFYESLKTVLESKGIKIIEIISHPWLEKYLFSKNDDVALFDFYYNAKKQFTQFIEQPTKSTSPELIREVNQILANELK